MNEWMNEWYGTHTIEYYSVIRKDEILSYATTCMDLEGITLTEISQMEKGKYRMTSLRGDYKVIFNKNKWPNKTK